MNDVIGRVFSFGQKVHPDARGRDAKLTSGADLHVARLIPASLSETAA